MARTIVLTGYDDAFAEVGDLTAPRIQAYAELQGFDYSCLRTYHDRMHPSFQKVGFAQRHLLDVTYDTVIWIDADVVVTNMDFNPLPRCKPGLNVSQDWGIQKPGVSLYYHFSMGVFIATVEALPVLTWLAQQKSHYFVPLWEQSALQQGADKYALLSRWVNVHPRRFMNAVDAELGRLIDPATGRLGHEDNPPQEPWQEGDWLCHLTGRPNYERLIQLKHYGLSN